MGTEDGHISIDVSTLDTSLQNAVELECQVSSVGFFFPVKIKQTKEYHLLVSHTFYSSVTFINWLDNKKWRPLQYYLFRQSDINFPY